MLRVRLCEARPGMVLASPVFHPTRRGTILLRPGVRLEDRVIDRLKDMHLDEVWIEYPGLEQVMEFMSPEISKARSEILALISRAFDDLMERTDPTLPFGAFKGAVGGLVNKLGEHPQSAVFIQQIAAAGDEALRHASNVCYISLLMGLRLEFYLIRERPKLNASRARDVAPLGVAAMLADIGMLRLEDEVLERWRLTHDDSDPEWRRHVRIGYEMVRGGLEPAAAAAVLNHHQHYDGSGFPPRRGSNGEVISLKGSSIHIFSRIITAADLFERVRVPPPGEDGASHPIPTVRALRMLGTEPYRNWIDPVVYRGLLTVVPPYAPGSLVTLSNGKRGAVLSWNAADPCRPTVQEVDLDNTQPDKYAEPVVHDLSELKTLSVVEIDGQDVSADNFYPSSKFSFDLAATEKAMMNAAAESAQEADETTRKAG